MKRLIISESEEKLLASMKSEPVTLSPDYDGKTAWLAALLAEIAHQPFAFKLPDAAKSLLMETLIDALGAGAAEGCNSLDIKIAGTYDTPQTQGFLASMDGFLVLAFGDNQPCDYEDIKEDEKARLADCESGGSVHLGFKEAYEGVANSIKRDLDAQENISKPLLICGHGRGGAVAAIAAKRLSHQGGKVCCHTFGAPCSGDSNWCEKITTPIHRFVNAFDCVPNLPPQMSMITKFNKHFGSRYLKSMEQHVGFQHAGTLQYLSACKAANHQDVELISGKLDRITSALLLKARMEPHEHEADHNIIFYRQKIAILAQRGSKAN